MPSRSGSTCACSSRPLGPPSITTVGLASAACSYRRPLLPEHLPRCRPQALPSPGTLPRYAGTPAPLPPPCSSRLARASQTLPLRFATNTPEPLVLFFFTPFCPKNAGTTTGGSPHPAPVPAGWVASARPWVGGAAGQGGRRGLRIKPGLFLYCKVITGAFPILNLLRAPRRDWIPPGAWRQFSCHTSPASEPRQRPLLASHRDPCAAELPAHLPRWQPRERGRGPRWGPQFGAGSGVSPRALGRLAQPPRASLSAQQDLGSSPVKPRPYGTFSLGLPPGALAKLPPVWPPRHPRPSPLPVGTFGVPGAPLQPHEGRRWLSVPSLGWRRSRPLPVLSPCHGLAEEPVPLLWPRRRKLRAAFAAAPFIPRMGERFYPCLRAAGSGERFWGGGTRDPVEFAKPLLNIWDQPPPRPSQRTAAHPSACHEQPPKWSRCRTWGCPQAPPAASLPLFGRDRMGWEASAGAGADGHKRP